MVDIETGFRLGQIIFAALIATVPPLYPNHSLYTRHALKGIEKMREVREKADGYEIGWIEKGEKEFGPLHQAVDSYRPIDGRVQKLGCYGWRVGKI